MVCKRFSSLIHAFSILSYNKNFSRISRTWRVFLLYEFFHEQSLHLCFEVSLSKIDKKMGFPLYGFFHVLSYEFSEYISLGKICMEMDIYLHESFHAFCRLVYFLISYHKIYMNTFCEYFHASSDSANAWNFSHKSCIYRAFPLYDSFYAFLRL